MAGKKKAYQLDREIRAALYGHSTMFGKGPGSGTHAASHASDAEDIPDSESSTGWSQAYAIAKQMRDALWSIGQATSAIKAYGDGSFSFQALEPPMYKDQRGRLYKSPDEPDARRASARGQLERIPEALVSRHFDKRGRMTVTDHSRGAEGTHPNETGYIRKAQPWKGRK